jgi:hypothetical protein
MSKPNLQGCTPAAKQNDLKETMRWLEELRKKIAILKSSKYNFKGSRPDFIMRLIIWHAQLLCNKVEPTYDDRDGVK